MRDYRAVAEAFLSMPAGKPKPGRKLKKLTDEVEAEGEAPGFDNTVKRLAELPRENAETKKP